MPNINIQNKQLNLVKSTLTNKYNPIITNIFEKANYFIPWNKSFTKNPELNEKLAEKFESVLSDKSEIIYTTTSTNQISGVNENFIDEIMNF